MSGAKDKEVSNIGKVIAVSKEVEEITVGMELILKNMQEQKLKTEMKSI